jgi:SecD/SecF fusion protein
VDEVRSALTDAGVPDADSAEIQEVEEPEFGENVVQIQSEELQPEGVGGVRQTLIQDFGLVEDGFQNTSVGPTFGEQVARSAVLAILFSMLVISAYVAIRFEAKYAIPVLIALVHDILITGGVYSLADREVTSATVAAFLTILGYSMYDTIIVFDRIRENVPRMPRAAFSQIVNRSMSEIFTRSLITGLSTVFLLTVLLIFGGETLTDFAFAMMVGIASGFYSSIFIASPVLTAWKEREAQYRNRRAVLEEAMGYVPAFPEENIVERVEEARREPVPALAGEAAAVGPDGEPGEGEPVGAVGEPAKPPRDGASSPGKPDELVGAGADGEGRRPKSERQRSRRRQQRRRRKHGRNR